jgi:hypothetical protein
VNVEGHNPNLILLYQFPGEASQAISNNAYFISHENLFLLKKSFGAFSAETS